MNLLEFLTYAFTDLEKYFYEVDEDLAAFRREGLSYKEALKKSIEKHRADRRKNWDLYKRDYTKDRYRTQEPRTITNSENWYINIPGIFETKIPHEPLRISFPSHSDDWDEDKINYDFEIELGEDVRIRILYTVNNAYWSYNSEDFSLYPYPKSYPTKIYNVEVNSASIPEEDIPKIVIAPYDFQHTLALGQLGKKKELPNAAVNYVEEFGPNFFHPNRFRKDLISIDEMYARKEEGKEHEQEEPASKKGKYGGRRRTRCKRRRTRSRKQRRMSRKRKY